MKQRLERWFDRLDRARGRSHVDSVASPYRAGIRSVTEAPLPRASRWLLMVLVLLLILALAWATFGRIDVVGSAQGMTIVSSRVKPIQASERGRVDAVLVSQGDRVESGQALVRLEATSAHAEVRDLEGQLARARAARARLRGLLAADAATDFAASTAPAEPGFEVDSELPEATTRRARGLMQSQWRAYLDHVRELRSQRANRLARQETARASVESIEAVLPYLESKVDRLRRLTDSAAVSQQKLDDARQKLAAKRQERRVQQRRFDEAQTELALMDQRITGAQSQFREKRATELSDMQSRLATIRQKLVKARNTLERRELRSPINGIVQDLTIHSRGAVVRPADTLMRVVPDDQPVEIQARILNRDIGFAHVGQAVDVKFQAYDFTRYGDVPGTIREIASTSTQNKKLGQVYEALVTLERPFIRVDGKRVRLRPGLTATVDIDMGSRRIVEYFLQPLLRYKDEALRER